MREISYLTSELVKYPSVSMEPFLNSKGIKEASIFIASWLKENDVKVHVLDLDNGWPSIIAGATDPKILLLGHFDVVPPGDEKAWNFPPFSGEIENGKVMGRGSNDMKGGVAVFMELMKEYPNQLGMFLSPDEEIGSLHSTSIYVNKIKPSLVLVSEPSGSTNLVVGEKGMIIARINIAGKTAHGSLPWRGESSLTNLLNSLEKLKNMLNNMSVKIPEPLREAYNNSQRIFGEDTIKITINVGVLSSGTVPTMVPDHSTAKLDIRIPHGVDVNYVSELIREMGFKVEFSTEPNYYLGKWEELFLKSAREVGKNLIEVIDPADNDGRLFRARNIPSLCYGPGNEFNSHVYNEFVEESELENTLNVYTHFIKGAISEVN